MRSKKQKIKSLRCVLLLISISVFLYGNVLAATHYVSSAGTATWAASTNIATPCSLNTANANAVAGDVIILRGGTYNTQIAPSRSGTSSSNRIAYESYNGETVIITQTGIYGNGIFLDDKDYIKITGISFANVGRLANIRNGSDYNEITECNFNGTNTYGAHSAFLIWGQCLGGSSYTCPSTHNWIHGNTFANSGYINPVDADDVGGNIYIGSATIGDTGSNYNTFENNIVYAGAHHTMETYSKYNVVRNNIFHNEGWLDGVQACVWGPSARNGKYGNRNLQVYDGHSQGNLYNLIESNRLGHAAFASDGGMDGNLIITSEGNIVRYNDSYNSETMGIYLKQGALSNSSNNRIYNNTIYNSGQDSQIYPTAWTGYGDHDLRRGLYIADGKLSRGNIIKNNLIYNSYLTDITCDATCQANNTLTNNWITTDGNPFFTNPDVSDPTSTTLPNLALQRSSPAIDAGTYLTIANGSGANSRTLVVNDALYFQDGKLGSALAGHQADWIAIGSADNIVQIQTIDYSINKITLATPMSWNNGALIRLYKKSDGAQVLLGSAPDMGAHEYGYGNDATSYSEDPAPTIPTTPTVPPTIAVSPTTKDFGSLPINTSSPAQRFTVTTTGGNLNVDAISMTGTDATQFAIQNDSCTGKIIAPETGSCTFDVKFSPSTVGTKAANVAIVDNDSNTSKLIAVSGTGASQIPAISFSPTSLSFSNVLSGTLSSPQTIRVSNTSTNFVTISSISLSGTYANQFSIPAATDYCTGETVAASGNCSFQVIFAPTSGGEKTANVNLTALYYSNPATLPLYGSAVVYQSPVPRIKISKTK